MSEEFRYEFFSFFLISLAFWLTTRRLAVFALIAAFLAAETQPAALFAVLPTIVLLNVHSSTRLKLISQAFFAALVSGSAYLWLHPSAIQSMMATRGGIPWRPFSGGLIFSYFIYTPRHILELVVLVVGAVLFWVHRAQIARPEVGYIAVMVTVYFLIFPHPNPYYMSLALPFPMLAALLGYQQSKRFAWMPASVICLMLGSYAYRFEFNAQQGYDNKDIVMVGNLIRQAEVTLHLNDADVRIVGDWSLWYAHPHYYLASYSRTADVGRGALYLCDEQTNWTWGNPSLWKWSNATAPTQVSCASLKARIPLELISHFEIRGRQFSLYRKQGS